MTNQSTNTDALANLSNELAAAVARIAGSIVRVDDGARLTASGVVWADGLIVATSHGVERDDDLAIVTHDGTRIAAVLVGRDDETDIAVLKADTAGLAPATRSEDVQVGNIVLAVGRPGNAGLHATFGIVSARLEAQSAGRPEHILHTDAVVYPGVSGGALIDAFGQIVGLLNRSLGRGQGVALGVSIVEHVVEDIRTIGATKRGYLGVSTQGVSLPASASEALGRDQQTGLLVVQVASGSGAETAGLFLGDTMVAINGRQLDAVDDLRSALRSVNAGSEISIQFIRAGQAATVTATLGEA